MLRSHGSILTSTVRFLSMSLLLICLGCGDTSRETVSVITPSPLSSPAGAGSRYPNLSVDSQNRVYLSWFEERDEAQALMWSRLDGEEWSAPQVIAEGDSFFVNWADFPSLIPLNEGHLVAHWPWKSGSSTYAYDVRMALSADGGMSWSNVVTPHDDGTPTEHGFVSLLPESDGVRAFWLDGRNFAEQGGHDGHGSDEGAGPSMTLRTAVLGIDGSVSDGVVLDERTCDCCPTAAVATASGLIVAYRDRDEVEVRDISIVHYDGEAWSTPMTIHADGWKIAACPVNGPALAARDDDVIATWYSEAGEQQRVLAVFSGDGGKTFGEPVELHSGTPIGRVDVVYLDDGSALVTWVEQEEDQAFIRMRRIRPDGSLDEPVTVTTTSASRASGFPRLVRAGDRLVFAWTEVGEPPNIRLAEARLAP